MLLCFIVILLSICEAEECSPSSTLYTLDITYQKNAKSQSISVTRISNNSYPFIGSYFGYGKDNLHSVNNICLTEALHQILCYDGVRNSWTDGSYFVLKVFDTVVLKGTVDTGKYREYYIYPYHPVLPTDAWNVTDQSEISDDWKYESYNDVMWDTVYPDSIRPIPKERFYRNRFTIDAKRLSLFSSFTISITVNGLIDVYLNGITLIRKVTPETLYPFTYTRKFPIYSHFVKSTNLLAIHVTNPPEITDVMDPPVKDPFRCFLLFLYHGSYATAAYQLSSDHAKDYYANPVESVFDMNRRTYWMFNGESAYVTFSDIKGMGEYVNQYTVTSASIDDSSKDPKAWRLWASHDNTNFVLLDTKANVFFDYRMQSKSFVLTGEPDSYRFYRFEITNSRSRHKTVIGELSFSSVATTVLNTLLYDQQNYTLYYQFDIVNINPKSTGFSHFQLYDGKMPAELTLDSESGNIFGVVDRIATFVLQIVAENMKDHSKSSTVVQINMIECPADHTIIALNKIDYDNSGSECYSFYSYEHCGSNNYNTVRRYYCIPQQPFSLFCYLSSNMKSPQNQMQMERPGSLGIYLPYPSFPDRYGRSEEYKRTAKQLAFYGVAERIYLLGEAVSITVNPCFAINENTKWKAKDDGNPGENWSSPDYDDSTWKDYSTENPYLNPSVAYYFRTWITIDSEEYRRKITSIEIKLRIVGMIRVYINGVLVNQGEKSSVKTWLTMTLPKKPLCNGRNLVAVSIIMDQEYHNDVYYLLRFVLRFTMELERSNRLMDVTPIGDALKRYPVENLISSDLIMDWRADLSQSGNAANVYFRLNYNSIHYMNRYCMYSVARSNQYEPMNWILSIVPAQSPSHRTSIEVDRQTNILWGKKRERKCFVLPESIGPFSGIGFQFFPSKDEHYVELSKIEFYSIPEFSSVLEYQYSIMEGFLYSVVKKNCPKLSHFSHFFIHPFLPWGMYLNGGTGCISGTTFTTLPPIKYQVSATAFNGSRTDTTISLSVEECQYPSSLLHLMFTKDISEDRFDVSYSVFTTDWKSVDSSRFLLYSNTTDHYGLCLKPNTYTLSFNDYTNIGDLATQYFLFLDNKLLQTSYFNPGFTQTWVSFIIPGNFDSTHTEWYYLVDGSRPFADWYKAIDPPKEPWQTAIPSKIPSFSGIAQFFKTVYVLSDPGAYSTIKVTILIKGGFLLYVNKKEVCRFNLPDGPVSYDTKALSEYEKEKEFVVFVPTAYSFFRKGTNVIAIELHYHDYPIPTSSVFSVDLLYTIPTYTALLSATPIYWNSTNRPENHISNINDGNYYNAYRVPGSKMQSIHFFTKKAQPEFCNTLRFFTSNAIASYPNSLALFGRFLRTEAEYELAKSGSEVKQRGWTKLLDVKDITMDGEYGNNRIFPFYNEMPFNEFNLVISNEESDQLEIAEVIFSVRNNGLFCDSRLLMESSVNDINDDFTVFIPSYSWFKLACPELYSGFISRYCNRGNWTKTINGCKCNPPSLFEYSSSLYRVPLRTFISIAPSYKGADVVFLSESRLPEGLHLDNSTGVLYGMLKEPTPLITLTILCININGQLETRVSFISYNNNEVELLIMAVIMMVLLIGLLLIIKTMKRRTSLESEQKSSVLHVDAIPKEMRSILL